MAEVVILKRSGLKFVPVSDADTIVVKDVKFEDVLFGKTDITSITNHIASTANPHGVTKSQILTGDLIVNADVDASAAIDESKLNLDYATSTLQTQINAISGGASFGQFVKVMTSVATPSNGTLLSAILPLADDDAPNLVVGDFDAGDFIVFAAGTTAKIVEVYEDTGLKVRDTGVTALIDNKLYHVRHNLLNSPDSQEVRAIYAYDTGATKMTLIADEVWDSAIGITLGSYTAGAGTITGADSVLSALQKLDGNKIAKTQIKTILSGDEAVDVPSVSAVNVGLATKIDKVISLINSEAGQFDAGKVAYLDGGDAAYASKDADLTVPELESLFICVANTASSASGDFNKPNSKFTLTGTKGNVAYLNTAGTITTVEPTTGDIVVLGQWVATDTFYFKPRYIVTK